MTDIQDAQNATQKTSNDPVAAADSAPPAPPSTRVNQQAVLPTAVQTKTFSNLIQTNPSPTWLYVPTAAAVSHARNFTFTPQTSGQEQQVLAVPDMSLYIGITDISQVDSSAQWPRTGFDVQSFPVFFINSDWGMTDGVDQVARIAWYNNSGSYQDVLIVCQFRYIVQPQALGASR